METEVMVFESWPCWIMEYLLYWLLVTRLERQRYWWTGKPQYLTI